MNNTISPQLTAKLNNSTISSTSNTQVQQPIKTNEPKQDSFIKSDVAKIAGITTGGVTTGGIIGVLKEKFSPKTIPEEIISEYDISKFDRYDNIIYNKETTIYEKVALMLKSTVSKMLNGTELTKEEMDFVNNSKIILPEDVRFLASDESPFKEFLQDGVLGENISDARVYYGTLSTFCPSSGLMGGQGTWLSAQDRINDFLNNGGKYSDGEEFLDYMTSRFYKGATFKVVTDKNGSISYVPSDILKETLSEGATLSSETYNYKEIVKHAKEHGMTSYLSVKTDLTTENPFKIYANNVYNQALEEAKTELGQAKNAVIEKFQNKQLLKSTGIGAAMVGALALGGSIIYNKVKKSKQSNQSV